LRWAERVVGEFLEVAAISKRASRVAGSSITAAITEGALLAGDKRQLIRFPAFLLAIFLHDLWARFNGAGVEI
jgi:hypothetical protein